jgi:hypothetical protein
MTTEQNKVTVRRFCEEVWDALPGEARAAVWQQVHEVARPYHFGEGYDFPAVCLNVVTH